MRAKIGATHSVGCMTKSGELIAQAHVARGASHINDTRVPSLFDR